MKRRLLPCPFCGGKPVLTKDFAVYHGAPVAITCQNCGATRTDYSVNDAKLGWNARIYALQSA